MRETLFFDVKPVSLNQCKEAKYYPKKGNGGMPIETTVKSKAYRKFEAEMKVSISYQMDRIKKIANAYKHGKNFFIMSYLFKFPRKDLITSFGTINKRCADLDNLMKPVNDSIFKYLAEYNTEIDDAAIIGLKALKVPSDVGEHKIIVEMSLRETLEGYTIY